jgi:hypothetical protein
LLGGGEVDGKLGGWVVAPGNGGVEIADEVLGEARCESFAAELDGEGVGEVLVHDKGDEEGVAWGPGGRLVAKETELEWEMGLLDTDGGVDSGGVTLKGVELIGWQCGDGAVGGGAKLKGSLDAVMGEKRWAENLGEGAGGVAAEGVQLPEAVLRGDEALGDEEVVE